MLEGACVQGLEFLGFRGVRSQGPGFRVEGSWFRVRGLGLRLQGLGCRDVQCRVYKRFLEGSGLRVHYCREVVYCQLFKLAYYRNVQTRTVGSTISWGILLSYMTYPKLMLIVKAFTGGTPFSRLQDLVSPSFRFRVLGFLGSRAQGLEFRVFGFI